MIIVVVEGSSLVAIIAKWRASMVDLWYGGCAIPTPIHFKGIASPDELKIMSRLCGKLYCVSCVRHVSGE